MKKRAFTLSEAIIASILIGIFSVAMMSTMRPNDIKVDAIKKLGLNTLLQIDFASKQILAKKTKNYSYTGLIDDSGNKYSITDSGADAKLINSFKKYLMGTRNNTLSATYKNSNIINDTGASVGSLKVSSFANGFKLKNGAYFAIKLNGNCTTNETLIYNPSTPDNRNASNSCGLAFFDVNGEDEPNKVLLDQYIVSIGKLGIR